MLMLAMTRTTVSCGGGQAGDEIAWLCSTPTREEQALYRVTATVAVEIDIHLPLAGTWPHAEKLLFSLLVDADSRAVQDWRADFDRAVAVSH